MIKASTLRGGSVPFDQATLQYQIVIQQNNGDTSIRTPILADIAVQACGASSGGQTDACNAFTDQRTCIAKNCNWWQINATTFVCVSKP